ncbi:hypothetical protein [Anaerophilus nitritogenes]|uniref:hypothetical protein n=1 Tax=Anaerophilus nitritogenes TaxID=2498136 RepID=UPI00101DBDFF|nr:hypothetical protein [Anaerophilus nitritogenes]
MKYCTLCKRYVEPTKSKWNWGLFILLCVTVVGGIGYAIHHVFMKSKNRCPICATKQLIKYSPEDVEAKKLEKQEKKEARKEMIDNVKNKINEVRE